MLRKLSLQLSLVLVVLATCGFAFGDTIITVPNASFEDPGMDPDNYVFWAWTSPSDPGIWGCSGEGGIVNNGNNRFGVNPTGIDGSQVAFLDGPTCGCWLDGITTSRSANRTP